MQFNFEMSYNAMQTQYDHDCKHMYKCMTLFGMEDKGEDVDIFSVPAALLAICACVCASLVDSVIFKA